MIARIAGLLCLALAGCAVSATDTPAQRAAVMSPLPPMKLFAPTRATPPLAGGFMARRWLKRR
jgi:hypothetical protein